MAPLRRGRARRLRPAARAPRHEALRRRLEKRIYIPLPDSSARQTMFNLHLSSVKVSCEDDSAAQGSGATAPLQQAVAEQEKRLGQLGGGDAVVALTM